MIRVARERPEIETTNAGEPAGGMTMSRQRLVIFDDGGLGSYYLGAGKRPQEIVHRFSADTPPADAVRIALGGASNNSDSARYDQSRGPATEVGDPCPWGGWRFATVAEVDGSRHQLTPSPVACTGAFPDDE